MMKGVFLDRASLDRQDLNLDGLLSLPVDWTFFDETSVDETVDRVANANIIITNKVRVDAVHFERARNLNLVCVAATGTNNVDLAAADRHRVPVCNVRGYATPSVVQHVFSVLLQLLTKQTQYTDRVYAGDWSRSSHFCLLDFPIDELAGKKLGIIGYGELGHGVARVAEAFDMQVLIAQSFVGPPDPDRIPLKQLLSEADVVTLHCPLSEHTRNLIDENALARMKPTAYLINAARGGIVDESALLQALKTNRLAGAALDVLAAEPPPADHVLLRERLPNLIVTPHVAWASLPSRQRLTDALVENIRLFLQDTPRWVVNL